MGLDPRNLLRSKPTDSGRAVLSWVDLVKMRRKSGPVGINDDRDLFRGYKYFRLGVLHADNQKLVEFEIVDVYCK